MRNARGKHSKSNRISEKGEEQKETKGKTSGKQEEIKKKAKL